MPSKLPTGGLKAHTMPLPPRTGSSRKSSQVILSIRTMPCTYDQRPLPRHTHIAPRTKGGDCRVGKQRRIQMHCLIVIQGQYDDSTHIAQASSVLFRHYEKGEDDAQFADNNNKQGTDSKMEQQTNLRSSSNCNHSSKPFHRPVSPSA